MHFDQDTIKELAVYAVQQFVSNQVPLDDSIAEKARSLNLNEDQVRRVVESTNVIAFLKLREGTEDKAFEFKVASLPGVMESLLDRGTDRGYVDVTAPEEVIEKTAFDVSAEVPHDQIHQALAKSLYHVRGELEKVAQEQYNCVSDLERLVPVLVKQAHWQERLQTVTSEKDFTRIISAFGQNGFEKSASLRDMVFVGKELETASRVVELIKSAGELSVKRSELEALEKKAVFGLGKLARNALSSLAKSPASKAAKATAQGIAKPIPAAKAAKSTLSSAMQAKEKAVAWTGAKPKLGPSPKVDFKPLRSAAAAAAAVPAAVVGGAVKATVGSAKAINKTKFGLMGVGGLAITSATYEPKINPRTGRTNDVWNNIYN